MTVKRKESVLVFSAHSDDFVIGAGGTIAQYAKEGRKVTAIVFSYGEQSHPWLQEAIVQKMRAKETLEASMLLGCETIFFDLREFHFQEDYRMKKVEKDLLAIINKERPTKIFTHSHEDPHPDHHAVHEITRSLLERMKYKPEVYIYSVWNPVSFKTLYPTLYVNISRHFGLKLKAMKTFRSQRIHVAYPFFLLLLRAVISGIKIRTTFAEKFFRIR
ncbi:TPA: PIG-L family deacetylase [Candidatus Woesearchaeota archaeon]|nr:PIG-L family deacetylase [Candidatus Woesearchaeota archaeon]HIG92793.1 PIG-L family deacetylase [Candidatus Woesearchaeota archaeon]